MEYVSIVFYFIAAYILFCKAWPYFLYPNYFRKSKIENYPELMVVAFRLRNTDKFQTLENVYQYMQETYAGYHDVLNIKNLLSIFKFGDFSTEEILNKKQFLWCHTQNRLFKSILVNTGVFGKDEVKIKKRLWRTFYIHQWLYINLDCKKIIVDPYYGVFKTEG